MKLKLTIQEPLNSKWIRPIDKVGKCIKHKWVNLDLCRYNLSKISIKPS